MHGTWFMSTNKKQLTTRVTTPPHIWYKMETSVVTPNLDISKVEAINQKRTLAFINHWVLHTVAFLNQFSRVCEERLVDLNTKLRRASHTLAILEAKLNSVPGLENVIAPTIETAVTVETTSENNTTTIVTDPQQNTTALTQESTSSTTIATESQDVVDEGTDTVTAATEVSRTPISQDPRYARYFKMLKMGVPDPAVRMKMSSEGVDPSILDDPDAPAPPENNTTDQDKDSDSSADESWSD